MKQIVSGATDGGVIIENLRPGLLPWRFDGHQAAVTGICMTAVGDYVISASADSTVRVWENKMPVGKPKY